jgi:hypothetical protein
MRACWDGDTERLRALEASLSGDTGGCWGLGASVLLNDEKGTGRHYCTLLQVIESLTINPRVNLRV